MTNYSRTTLRELKKRYLNVLKKCLLANLGLILLSTPSIAEEIVFDEVYDSIIKESTTGGYQGAFFRNKAEFGSVKFTNNTISTTHNLQGGFGVVWSSGGSTTFKGHVLAENNTFGSGTYGYGGFINVGINSTVTFETAEFLNNTFTFNPQSGSQGMSGGGGTILSNEDGFIHLKGETLFQGNFANKGFGGAIYNQGSGTKNTETNQIEKYGITFDQKATFIGNEATTFGGAILNGGGLYSGSILFKDNAYFGVKYNNDGTKIISGNKASNGGAIYNIGVSVVDFMSTAKFVSNEATNGSGGAILNGGTINFTSADFIENSNFGDAIGESGGAIKNSGTMTFTGHANFIKNISIGDAKGLASDGGAIRNSGTIVFNSANFTNNKIESKQYNTYGAAISNNGTITFNGDVLFNKNESDAFQSEVGGAINNTGTITFNKSVTFLNNKVSAFGGVFSNDGTINFSNLKDLNDWTVLVNNTFSRNPGTLNFNSNTLVYNDGGIHNVGGTINIQNNEGTFAIFSGGIGGGDHNQKGKINKLGNGIMIFGDNAPNNLLTYEGAYIQTDGITIAKTDKFFGHKNAVNVINGGVLSVHGGVPTFTATLGNAVNEDGVKSSGTFELQSNLTDVLNVSTITNNILIAEGATETKIILGAYRDTEKIAHENLIKNKKVSYTNEDGTTTDQSLESLTYVDENGVTQTYDVISNLFNTTTLGTANAKYHLDKDVGTEGNTISFENADVTFGLNEYKNGTYELTNSAVINLQNDKIEETNVTFADLDGSGATLSIDIALLKDSEGKTQLTADRLNLTSDGEGYKFAGVSFNTPMNGQALLDEILSGLMVGQDGTITPSIKHTVQVLGGNASFMGRKEATLSTASPYVYEVATSGQDLTVSADVLKGSALEYLNDTDTDVTLQIAEKGSTDYTVTEDLGEMGYGTKQILGSTEGGAIKSVINANGKELFTLNNKDTSLTIKDVTITGAGTAIDNQSGKAHLENVVIKDTVGDTALKNGATLTLKDVVVDKGVVNSGKLTMSGNNALSTLTNSGETTVEGGKLSVTTLGGAGTLTMNGSELDSTNIATNNTIVSNGMTVSDRLSTLGVKSLEVKDGTTLDLNLAMTTADKIKNEGDMIANKDLSVGALEGTGTLTVNNATLDVADKFATTNKVVSNGMKIGDNVTSEIHFADLEIAKDTTLDIKTLQATANTLTVRENATLGVTLNGLNDHGTMKAEEIIAETDAKVHLKLGSNFTGGVFDVFKGTKGAGDLELVHNNVYNVVEVEEGKYSFMTKDKEALQESLGATDEETNVASAITLGSSKHALFSQMQKEVLLTLQSEDNNTVEKAKKALNALGGRNTSLYQSQATAGFTQLHNVVSQMLMNTAAPVFGHAGGEEPARASVYVKGLYDRVNSLTGDGFRMRSKGAVLGVQSAVTEDLTVGVGYAGIDTTAKEPLRRTEVKTNTGFISAQYQPNNWWVSGVVTYSRSQYDEEKQVLSSTGKANYDVDSLGAQITTGYNIKKGKVILTPEVGVRYLNARQEGYTDSLGTTVEGTNSDFVTTMAGFKVGADLGWIRPLAGVMVGYDVITDDVSSVNTLANGATYTIQGQALDRLSTTVVAGFGMDLGDNATLKLEYNGNYRKEYLDHSGMLRLEWKF